MCIPFCHKPSCFMYYPSDVTILIVKIPECAPGIFRHFPFATVHSGTWVYIIDNVCRDIHSETRISGYSRRSIGEADVDVKSFSSSIYRSLHHEPNTQVRGISCLTSQVVLLRFGDFCFQLHHTIQFVLQSSCIIWLHLIQLCDWVKVYY